MQALFFLRLAVVSLALAVEPGTPTTTATEPKSSGESVKEPGQGDVKRDRLKAILNSKIDLDFDGASLLDVLNTIRVKTGVNLLFDAKSLEGAGVNLREDPVTINVAGISVRVALTMILREHDMAWLCRDDEMIVVTTDAQAETMLELRVYAVGDLVVRPGGGWPHATHRAKMYEADEGISVGSISDVDTLIETITSTVARTTWGEVGGAGAIKFLPNALALVVSQTQEVHNEIEDLLERLREARRLQVASSAHTNPTDLVLASYAMPRHAPTWQAGWPGSPAQSAGAELYEAELKTSLANAAATAKEFAALIPQVIEPASWKTAGGKGEIFIVNDRLVIQQTAAVQSQVAKLLRDNSPPFPAEAPSGRGYSLIGNSGS